MNEPNKIFPHLHHNIFEEDFSNLIQSETISGRNWRVSPCLEDARNTVFTHNKQGTFTSHNHRDFALLIQSNCKYWTSILYLLRPPLIIILCFIFYVLYTEWKLRWTQKTQVIFLWKSISSDLVPYEHLSAIRRTLDRIYCELPSRTLSNFAQNYIYSGFIPSQNFHTDL